MIADKSRRRVAVVFQLRRIVERQLYRNADTYCRFPSPCKPHKADTHQVARVAPNQCIVVIVVSSYTMITRFPQAVQSNAQVLTVHLPFPLLLRSREWMTAHFPAKRVANLGNDLDLRGVIIFGIFELIDRMLVINRVGGKMYQITRIIAE